MTDCGDIIDIIGIVQPTTAGDLQPTTTEISRVDIQIIMDIGYITNNKWDYNGDMMGTMCRECNEWTYITPYKDSQTTIWSIINGHSRILNWRYLPYIRPI